MPPLPPERPKTAKITPYYRRLVMGGTRWHPCHPYAPFSRLECVQVRLNAPLGAGRDGRTQKRRAVSRPASGDGLANVPHPFQMRGMGSKSFRLMFDFARHRCVLAVECESCGRRARLGDFREYWSVTVRDYTRRLRCARCGSRRVTWFPMPRDMG